MLKSSSGNTLYQPQSICGRVRHMKSILYVICAIALLSTAGCIFPGDQGYRGDRGDRGGGGYSDHGDYRGGDHGDNGGYQDEDH